MVSLAFQGSFGGVSPSQDLAGSHPKRCTFFPAVSYKVFTVLKPKPSGAGGRTKRKHHQEETEPGEQQVHEAAPLSLSHKGLSEISYQEEVKLPFSKEKRFEVCHFQPSWGCRAVPDHVLNPPRFSSH